MTSSSEIALPSAMPGIELAKDILCRLFRDFDGCLRICLWDGSEVHLGRDQPTFSLTFRSAKAFQELVLSRDPLCLAESYFQGFVDIDGDLYSLLKLRHHLTSLQLSLIEKAALAANWSTHQDVLDLLREIGITTEFAMLPCSRGYAFDAWDERYEVVGSKTLFYMVNGGRARGRWTAPCWSRRVGWESRCASTAGLIVWKAPGFLPPVPRRRMPSRLATTLKLPCRTASG